MFDFKLNFDPDDWDAAREEIEGAYEDYVERNGPYRGCRLGAAGTTPLLLDFAEVDLLIRCLASSKERRAALLRTQLMETLTMHLLSSR